MKKFLKDNGLSVALLGLFLVSFVGQVLTGISQYNDQQEQHGSQPVGLAEYLRSGDFLEATFENWESEFLQMAAFLILSAKLAQKGSAESKDPDETEEKIDAKIPRPGRAPADAPGPVHRGGFALRLYSHSLSLTLAALFVMCFVLHAWGGARKFNEEAAEHGEATVSVFGFVASSTFWFESFQNWQSEFLSIAAVVILSIYLREKGSPESKEVQAPHRQTGN